MIAKLAVALLMISGAPVMSTVAIERQIVVPARPANVAVAPSTSPTVVAVRPVSQAAAIASTEFDRSSPFVSEPAPPALSRRTGRVVFAGMSVIDIVLIGAGVAALAMFARRRHRRRVAWGLVPDRSVGRSRRAG